ncbi:MAG: ParA family protein [Arthrobacter sp.]
MNATVYALINQKGGVGKTTETINLARVAVNAGRRVLVIDADPQGNATGILAGSTVTEDQLTFADVLAELPVADVVIDGIWDRLSLVPGNRNTDKATRALHSEHGRELRLREAVNKVRSRYDLILIDCAPSLELNTVNALAAADQAIVITEPGKFSLDGLGLLQSTFESIRRYYNPDLAVAGIVVNSLRRTIGHRTWVAELEEMTPWPMITPYIPFRSLIQDAQEAAVGLDEWPNDRARSREVHAMYTEHFTALTLPAVRKGR